MDGGERREDASPGRREGAREGRTIGQSRRMGREREGAVDAALGRGGAAARGRRGEGRGGAGAGREAGREESGAA